MIQENDVLPQAVLVQAELAVLADGGSFGRSLTLTALAAGVAPPTGWTGPVGTITLGGPVYLSRTDTLPNLAATFSASGRKIAVNDLLGSTDQVTLNATEIDLGSNALIVGGDATTVGLTATTFGFDPAALIAGIGTLSVTQAAGGTAPVVLPSFNGGTLTIAARGAITAGRIAATGDVTLQTPVAVTLTDRIDTAGTLLLDQSSGGALTALTFGPAGEIASSGTAVIDATTITSAGHGIATSGALTLASANSVTLKTLSAGSGTVTLTPTGRTVAGLTVTGALGVTGGDLKLTANGDLSLHDVAVAGALDTSFNNIAVGGAVTVAAANTGDALNLTGKGAVTFAKGASITGTNAAAQVNLSGASIAFDPTVTTKGTSFSAVSRGAVTVGAVLATPAQTVTVRGGPSAATGALSGATVTLASSTGGVAVGGPVTGGRLSVTAAQDIRTAGIAGTAAALNSTSGSVTIGGTTRINTTGLQSVATLTVNAGKTITVDGPTSAAGGVSLSAPTIVTTARGYLTDLDHPGVLTSLRAQTVNVAFNTGTTLGAALHVSLRGLTTTNAGDATFAFASLRPVTFDLLDADRTMLSAGTALTITKLNMADWLWLNLAGQSVALQGGKTPPAAGRTITTGALTAAKVVALPRATPAAAPTVTVNGTLR